MKIRLILTIVFSFVIFVPSVFSQNTPFDIYGGWTGAKANKTGFFHVQQVDNRWWIITPEGNVFWSVGMYCVRYGGIPETGTQKRAYRDACKNKYGNEKKWASFSKIQLKDWGFNTIGDWSSESIYTTASMAYAIGIDLSRKSYNVISEHSYGYFPDVFSLEFKRSVKDSMEKKFKRQPYLVDDPWLLGYFLADEPAWYGSKQRRGALVDDFISLDKGKPGKKAWVRFINERYSDIESLNTSWGTNFKTLDDLLFVTKIGDNSASRKDKYAFLKIIALEFSKTLTETLHQFDSNHMVLGSRPTRLYPEVVEAIGKYSDIFSMSSYGFNQGYTIDPQLPEELNKIYRLTNKPFMLGALIPARDTSLPYGIVRTQRDRGVSYWRYLARIASDSRVVGMHWFQYFDPPKNCYDAKAANWGLVNEQDEPYAKTVGLVKEANNMVYAYALGLSKFSPEFDKFLGFKKEDTPRAASGNQKRINIPIVNGDFENGSKNWKLQTWKGKGKTFIDSSQQYSKRNSLMIQGGSDEGWASVGVAIQPSPNFILKPGYQYKLSSWIKTDNVEHSAFVRIKSQYSSGEVIYIDTESAYGSDEWKYFEKVFTLKEENKVAHLVCQLVGKGVVWFDDIRLEVLLPDNSSLESFVVKDKIQSKLLLFSSQNTTKLELANPGFEQGSRDWIFQKWKGRPSIRIDGKIAHFGNKSLRIKSSALNPNSVGVAIRSDSEKIVLVPGKTYGLSAWIKIKDIKDKAFVRIKVKYDDGSQEYFQTDSLSGTNDWQMAYKEFKPMMKNKIEYMGCQVIGKGTAWFDDISLEELDTSIH